MLHFPAKPAPEPKLPIARAHASAQILAREGMRIADAASRPNGSASQNRRRCDFGEQMANLSCRVAGGRIRPTGNGPGMVYNSKRILRDRTAAAWFALAVYAARHIQLARSHGRGPARMRRSSIIKKASLAYGACCALVFCAILLLMACGVQSPLGRSIAYLLLAVSWSGVPLLPLSAFSLNGRACSASPAAPRFFFRLRPPLSAFSTRSLGFSSSSGVLPSDCPPRSPSC